jgi:hypothetical protein
MARRGISSVTSEDAPCAHDSMDSIDWTMISDAIQPRSPPVFYQNGFGVVTMRWQYLQFYKDQLASGQPIGPHVFGLRR